MVILATWMSQVFGVDRLWADSLGVFGHIHLAMRHVKGGCTLLPALSDLLPQDSVLCFLSLALAGF